jgi:hypothetical protein
MYRHCFDHERDILDQLHYLNLLEQCRRVFEDAKPLHQWRHHWPKDYDRMLEALRTRWPEEVSVKFLHGVKVVPQHCLILRLSVAILQPQLVSASGWFINVKMVGIL